MFLCINKYGSLLIETGIPASFCGLYSLKPSSGRFPTSGIRDGLGGQEAVRNTVGPMARSLEDVKLWCKSVVEKEPWVASDPECVPIPWRKVDMPQKLCIGMFVLINQIMHC